MGVDGAVGTSDDSQMELCAAGLEDQNIATAQFASSFVKAEAFSQLAKAFNAQIAHPVRRQIGHRPPAGLQSVANQTDAIQSMRRIAPAPAIRRTDKLRCALRQIGGDAAHEALVG